VHLRNGGNSDVEAVELIRRVFQLDLAPGAADGDAPAARTDAADAGPDPAGTESGRAPGRTESPS
jgi:hypothetical protein